MKRIYLLNIVAWNYRKKIGFPVCKKENFAGLHAHRKGGKSARASPTPHHTLDEERSARFTAQHLSALVSALCSSRFERQEGRPEVSDLRQGFLPLKIVQTLRLKARSSFLYPYLLVGCLNSNKWIIPVFRTIEVMHFDLRENNMSALNYERLAKLWNPGSVKPRMRNCTLQLMRFVLSHEKSNAKGLHQCCHVK